MGGSGRESLAGMEGISKTYPGVQALADVALDIRPGEVHALVGENGAGKSTLVRILSGITTADSGRIWIGEEDVVIKGPAHARRLGLATIFQEFSLVPTLTVADNVFLAHEITVRHFTLDRRAMLRQTDALLGRYGIGLDASAVVSRLSSAQRQLTEIVKAISRDPRILVMDEPTSSLTEAEAAVVYAIIDHFRARGAGIVFVSHKIDEIIRIADRITVLRDGRVVHQGPLGDLDAGRIVGFMAGRDAGLPVSRPRPPRSAAPVPPRMEVLGLTRQGAFEDVSFRVGAGEILGVAGLMGSGRSELARAIFGISPAELGEIRIDGQAVRIESVREAMSLGLALLPESRQTEGLIIKLSVGANAALTILERFRRAGLIRAKPLRRLVRAKIDELRVAPADLDGALSALSGGNQQKVLLAKWSLTEPRIMIFDEPTVGVDILAKSEIHDLIRRAAGAGAAIIVISSDMPELLSLSDRIMVMNKGRVLRIFEDATRERIMSLIMDDFMTARAVRARP